jgi:hypothetical protein
MAQGTLVTEEKKNDITFQFIMGERSIVNNTEATSTPNKIKRVFKVCLIQL